MVDVGDNVQIHIVDDSSLHTTLLEGSLATEATIKPLKRVQTSHNMKEEMLASDPLQIWSIPS